MDKIQLSRFESLGNNCEFAFFLRQNKVEVGSLFRWTLIHDFLSIVNLLSHDFDSLYLYENLQPTYQNMVRDKHYNIDFHTEMFSEKKMINGSGVMILKKIMRSISKKEKKSSI